MNDHLYQLLLVIAGGVIASIYPAFRNWRRDVKTEGADGALLQNLATAVGKLEGKVEKRLDDLEGDINGVAEMARKRFKALEKKDTALETFVTGKMPRVTDENDAVSGE